MSAKSHFTSFTSLSNNFSQVPLGILGLGQWQEDDEVNPGGTPCSRTISGSSEPIPNPSTFLTLFYFARMVRFYSSVRTELLDGVRSKRMFTEKLR